MNGLTGSEFNTLRTGEKVYVSRNHGDITQFNPEHSTAGVLEQMYETLNLTGPPSMNGFAESAFQLASASKTDPASAIADTMGYFTEEELPVIHSLAKNYAIIDSWFASTPGPTYPNRHFLHCATAGGWTNSMIMPLGFTFKTIYDSLNEAGRSWKVYSSGLYRDWEVEALFYRSLWQPRNLMRVKTISTCIFRYKPCTT